MMTMQRSRMFGSFTTLIDGLRQSMVKKSVLLRSAVVGLVLFVPSVALTGTVQIEVPFDSATLSTTPWFSEETSGWQSPGSFITGTHIRGAKADDFKLKFYALESGYTMKNEGAEIVARNEDGYTRLCPGDTWISSMRTTGGYSDNMHFRCSELWKGTVRVRWSNIAYGSFYWYSDENGSNDFSCPTASAMTGMRCDGDNCDNLLFVCNGFQK